MKTFKKLTNFETGLFETKNGTVLLAIKEKANKDNNDINIFIYKYIKSSVDDKQETGYRCIEELSDKYEYFEYMFFNYDIPLEEALNEV